MSASTGIVCTIGKMDAGLRNWLGMARFLEVGMITILCLLRNRALFEKWTLISLYIKKWGKW